MKTCVCNGRDEADGDKPRPYDVGALAMGMTSGRDKPRPYDIGGIAHGD